MARLLLFLLPFVLVVASGCEESVVPTLDGEAQFSLYGALDPEAESQAIRVFRIRERLEVPEPGTLGATFTSTELSTGEEQAWQDSIVTFADGTAGNVFTASFAPRFGETYRIEVEGETGAATSVVVTVPPRIVPLLRPPTFGMEGTAQEVFWPGAPRLNQAQVRLSLQSDECQTYNFDYQEASAAPIEFGWVVNVPFGSISNQVESELGVGPSRLSILEAEVRVEVASAAWNPPGGEFDPEALIEPGTFSNVSNGFGFVGANYPSSVRWRPSSEVAQRSGFRSNVFGDC